MLDVVRSSGRESGLLAHPRTDVGVGAAIPVRLDGARSHAPVAAHSGLHSYRRAVLRNRVELLVHRQRNPNRLAKEQRAHGDHRFELDVQLGAQPAAEVRRSDADAVLGPAEQTADLAAHERRTLGSGVDRQATGSLRLRQRDDRLERRVHHLSGAKGVLEHVVGTGKRLFHVAAAHVRVERDVRAASSRQVLQIRERPGRLEHVVNNGRPGTGCCYLVEHRLERLVFDGDQVSRLFGCVRIVGDGDRHRLADVPDFAECQDRLIVKGGSVIRMRNELQDVFGCDHRVHAFDFQRSRCIDADDAPVRYGAAVNPPVQHPGEAQVVDVFDRPVDLGQRFRAAESTGRFRETVDGRDRAHPQPVPRSASTLLQLSGSASRVAMSVPRVARRKRLCQRPADVNANHFALVGGAPTDVCQRFTPSAAASAAVAKVSGVGGAPVKIASAAVARTGRSVAALMATRASAIWLDSIRNHAATPTVGQSSADSAVNFAYAVQTPRRLGGHVHVRNQLVAFERRLVVADGKIVHVDPALSCSDRPLGRAR